MTLLIRHLRHAYALSEVLSGVDLSISPGQTLALVGPSGCGKSTLLHIVAGLLQPSGGVLRSNFRGVGCVFQQPRLLPWKHVLDNIGLGLKALRVPPTTRRQRAQALAKLFGLDEQDWAKFPFELSGGMQSRVALARALAISPDLLLLDEPFSALDIGLKSELYHVLRKQIQARQMAVLMITHDVMEAVYLADQVAVMSPAPGRILQIFHLDIPHEQRDDAWVYRTTGEMMRADAVRYSFGLPGGERYRMPAHEPHGGCRG